MSANKKIRVLIVDDVSETRENVRKLLQFEDDIDIVGTAGNGRESIRLSEELKPNVVLMDINMPDMDGIAATEIIRAKHPEIQVAILSVQGDQNYMRRAMLAGACDFLTKPPMGDELVSAIRRASDRGQEEETRLRMQINELELVVFDLETRRDLYKESVATGKLVDEIEVLIAGLAHDLRSPLSIILSILSTTKAEDPETVVFLRKLWRSCLYCKWIADTFLGISLSEKINPNRIHVKGEVDRLIGLLEDRVPPTIEIINDIDDDSMVYFDISTLNLALQNLLINSVESIIGNGKIFLGSERSKTHMLITVEDNGEAISPLSLDTIPQLGFTTKKFHAGIGLYVSRRLMRLQGGDLIFARDFGQKTKAFGILLPFETASETRFTKARQDQLLKYQAGLQKELSRLRSQEPSEAEGKQKSEQFRKITSSFSRMLSSELSVVEETILMIINGATQPRGELKKSFEKIIENCAYCRLLTNNIFEIGEGTTSSFKRISLVETILHIFTLVDRKMPSHLFHTNWDVDPLLPDIDGDDVQLKQVFMNLIKNAIDAMPNGGTISIKLERTGESVLIEVGDTGTGISPQNMPKLFHLGFTTKTKGYGIGLFSIKNILDRHHGRIEVSSKPGKGTVFKIHLPLTQPEYEVSNDRTI